MTVKLRTSNFELQTSNFRLQKQRSAASFLLPDATNMPSKPQPFHERGFNFACKIVRLYSAMTKRPDVPSYLARQVLRAGTSIGANLEEAKGAQTRRDAASKFSIALKEAREAAYW